MDIFDTDNIDDLPTELLREMKIISSSNIKILQLFSDSGGVLNLTGLLVGYYRKHKEVKARSHMMVNCYRLVKSGYLSPTNKKGEYYITKSGLSIVEKLRSSNV